MFLALWASLATADEVPQWTVTVDPLTTALGFGHVQVERALGERVSVYAGPHLRLFDGLLSEGHEPYLGYGVEVGVRVFFAMPAPTGCWAMARGVLAYAHTTDGTGLAAPAGYGSGLVGYTGIVGGWLVLSGGAGVQYLHYRVGDYGPVGIAPALHTNIGVAF